MKLLILKALSLLGFNAFSLLLLFQVVAIGDRMDEEERRLQVHSGVNNGVVWYGVILYGMLRYDIVGI